MTFTQKTLRPILNFLIERYFPDSCFYGHEYLDAFKKAYGDQKGTLQMFDYDTLPAEGGVEFKPWGKTPRNKGHQITITEKLDGTNACVIVRDGELVGLQSRNRLIKPGDDNMGFAFWAVDHAEELCKLGDGYHYGEWVGPGIQKNPHMLETKQFFLFNTFRPVETLPECVQNVPVLYRGPYKPAALEVTMRDLWATAGDAGYIPEGIIIYFHDTRTYMKDTFAYRGGKWQAGV